VDGGLEDSLTAVLGLGNPGARYAGTRHNLGFRVIERLAGDAATPLSAVGALGRLAWTARIDRPAGSMILAKPRTFMNRSGLAAAAICRHHGIPPERVLAVFDDADLELGRIRVRGAGRAGGHRGVASLIEALGSIEFPRIRLGVRGDGREGEPLEDYVLRPFELKEEPIADALVEIGAAAVRAVLVDGIGTAMNRYNGLRLAETNNDGGGTNPEPLR
jgi:PTH1 family peptidyl-tRNA hydrolase